MKKDLPKAYNPKNVEDDIYTLWETSGMFNPDNLDLPPDAETFSIPLPPPNATGTLHLGHAMYVIEDIMVRHARMQGKRTLWLPGTDHAAIAVNALVEKQLREEGMTRYDIGREAFIERVHAFIAQSQGTIKQQLKKMGFSLDWSREAYTMDDHHTHVVHDVFTRMFNDGLIYRGIRVINWDPHAQSTISDDEVEHKERDATLYTFRYNKDFPISISTTRPETKVGDTAVAVHPDDDRYKRYIGQTFDVPFAGTTLHITVIADKDIDMHFGTGALGVTPSHSIIDSEMAHKNHLPFITVIDENGVMTEKAGSLVAGLSTLDARKKIVAWLKEAGLMEKEETIKQNISVSERTGAVIEPLPKEQWFINVNAPFTFHQSTHRPIDGLTDGQQVTLKQVMKHVVESGQITIVPERFTKSYFHWVDHLRDWNISRQIWFGHSIPAWYKGDEIVVGDKPQGDGWVQDPDSLDTWFSSGTWTFSTLGWPEHTDDFQRYHPVSVLETGPDILPFWVSRMILMTTYATGEIPFETVYLHGLIRDKHGAKMSKSKGNGIDPLQMIGKYGTDALRLALVTGTTPGNDSRLYEEKIEGYRNFVNKLWNISRYILSNVENPRFVTELPELKTDADKWIVAQLQSTIKAVDAQMAEHQYGMAIETLYRFTWNDLADWYLEIAKIEGMKDHVLLYVLQTLLRLWHPYAPFITEHLYQKLDGHGATLMTEQWPEVRDAIDAPSSINAMQEMLTMIRTLRAEMHIPYSTTLHIAGDMGDAESQKHLIQYIGRVNVVENISGKTVALTPTIVVAIDGVVDTKGEKKKIAREIERCREYIAILERTLENEKFIRNAPSNVIEEKRKKLRETRKKYHHYQSQYNQL